MRKFRTLTDCSLLAMLSACATVNSPDVQTPAASVDLSPIVIGSGEPSDMMSLSEGELAKVDRPVVVPPGTLRISRVSRKRSEMREGPGVTFALTDRILEEGNRVIVFEQHGVWAKVLSLGYWDSGWVHINSITQPKLNKGNMTVNFAKFPTVLAVRPVNQGLAFAGGGSVRFNEAIPKGRMFRALQMTEDRTLIWIAERNDIVWIKGKDMQ